MDKKNEYIYFVNSQGKSVVLVDPNNTRYFEMKGRYGFSAPEVDIFSQKFASGKTKYFGKAIKPRTCGINMLVTGKTSAECDRVFFEMLEVLLDADGAGEGKLYVRRYDGLFLTLHCVYASGMRITEEYRRFRRFTVEFFAADPWFYDERKYDLSKYDDELTIVNRTSNNIYPYIYISEVYETSAIDDNDYITNATTDKTITFYTHSDAPILKRYVDIDIYTEESVRGIYGTYEYWNEDLDTSIPVPKLIGYDLSVLDFPIIPGKNEFVLHVARYGARSHRDNSHILVSVPYAGV